MLNWSVLRTTFNRQHFSTIGSQCQCQNPLVFSGLRNGGTGVLARPAGGDARLSMLYCGGAEVRKDSPLRPQGCREIP